MKDMLMLLNLLPWGIEKQFVFLTGLINTNERTESEYYSKLQYVASESVDV